MQDISIIGARRSYEYYPDQIRLTLLSNSPVVQHIRQMFGFEYGAVVQPTETFGPVPATIPPGLAFYYGLAPIPQDSVTPIRFIHIEPERIVIDIGGPSGVADKIFGMLLGAIGEITGSDGKQAVPAPEGVLDQSEIRFRGSFNPRALLPSGVYDAIAATLDEFTGRASEWTLPPALEVKPMALTRQLADLPWTDHLAFRLEPRINLPMGDTVYHSVAPLDTDAHLGLLTRIESAIQLG